MRHDLDRLMAARRLDAIVVGGKVKENPPLYYLLNGAGLTQAIFVKKRGEEATLIVGPMERGEAKAVGIPVRLTTRYGYHELLKTLRDPLQASVAYYRRIFEDLGITGRVGFYGMMDRGAAYRFLRALDEATDEIEVVGEFGGDLIAAARETKEPHEAERIRAAGRRTASVIHETIAFLRRHVVDDQGRLCWDDGRILRVGHVHDEIRRLIALHALEDPEGFIFATGSDAGIPHSKGSAEKAMRLGEVIVFDIFPREMGGGYFFDMTRTFCLGYAPPEVQALHLDVLECHNRILAALEAGRPAATYQRMACDFFRERGHPTVAEDPTTQEGYVHSLGHGVGLELHERPSFADRPGNDDRLQPGSVFTIEPGLYYPERGMGCRIEDVLWIDEKGALHNLTDYPYELIIPMPRWDGVL